MEDRGLNLLKIIRKKTVYMRFNEDGNLDENRPTEISIYRERIWKE